MLHNRTHMRLIVAMAIVALGSLAFGWTGAAPATGIETTVTIAYAKGKFTGSVAAAFPCQTGRQVTVEKIGKGAVGTATSNATGDWELAKRHARGKFRAVVAASAVADGSGYGYDSTPCDAGTSPTIEVKRKHHHRRRGGNGGGDFNFDRFFKRLEKLFPGFDFGSPTF